MATSAPNLVQPVSTPLLSLLNSRGAFYGGLLTVVAVASLLYLDALSHYFTADDFVILHQYRFKTPGVLDNLQFFGRDWGIGANFYRPLPRLGWALEYALFGQNAPGWHATSIALYSLNAGLVYGLVHRLTRMPLLALLTGLLFVFHPAHVEPVVWVADQTELLAASFGLGGCWLYFSYLLPTSPQASSKIRLTGAFICFGLALLCKESAVAFLIVPFLATLVYGFRPGSGKLSQWLTAKGWLPLVLSSLLLAGYIAGRWWLFGSLGGYTETEGYRFDLADFSTRYAYWLIRPFNPDRTLFRLGLAALCLILLTVTTLTEYFVAKLSRSVNTPTLPLTRLAIFGLGWLVLFLLPSLTSIPSLRFAYLSTVGVSLIVGVLFYPTAQITYPQILNTQKLANQNEAQFSLLQRFGRFYTHPLVTLIKLLVILVIFILAFNEVRARQQVWKQSAGLAEQTLVQIKSSVGQIPDFSAIYLANLPDYRTPEDSSPFYVGFPEATQLALNNATVEGKLVPAFSIIEQRLNQGYFFSYDGVKINLRLDVLDALQERNAKSKDRPKWQIAYDWSGGVASDNPGWRLEPGGVINPGSAGEINLKPASGVTLRLPAFSLPAMQLASFNFELNLTSNAPQHLVVAHWLVSTPQGLKERTSTPLIIDVSSPGANFRAYSIKPADMSAFLYTDTLAEIQLEIPAGVDSLTLRNARIYRLP